MAGTEGRDGGGGDQHCDDLARQSRKVEPSTLVLSLRSGGKLLHGGSPSRGRVGGAGARLVREHLPGGVSAAGQQAEAHRRLGFLFSLMF